MKPRKIITSFVEECVRPGDLVRYYSGFCEVGFFQGYNPATHQFDKRNVDRTGGHEAVWFHISKKLFWPVYPPELKKRFWESFSYWLQNKVLADGDIIKRPAQNNDSLKNAIGNAILITDRAIPIPGKGFEYDNPGYPVVFSGRVSYKDLDDNGFFHTDVKKKPIVDVDALYRVELNVDRKRFEEPKSVSLEDISSRL